MIGGIDSKADIDLYLQAEELEKLSTETIEGVLVRIERPERQGTINISVNDARKDEQGCGIGIDDKKYWGVKEDFCVEVFMGTVYYQKLKETGRVKIRHRMRDGAKINIYDRSRADFIEKIGATNFEFYRDNKEKLK